MQQLIPILNIILRFKRFKDKIDNITLRGYVEDTYLTGEFLNKITSKEIKLLSVSDISDVICPTRRDLYLRKGKNKPNKVPRRKTWGRVAGNLVEQYFVHVKRIRSSPRSYRTIIRKARSISTRFLKEFGSELRKMDRLKSGEWESSENFLELLSLNGRYELIFKLVNSILEKDSLVSMKDIDINTSLHPNQVIGISSPVKPDFIIPTKGIVGDIKSGIGGFKDRFVLTCTGYALAYENEHKKDINFGLIYYLPTRYTTYAKTSGFVQVYFVLIDDNARSYFLHMRDQAYQIISKEKIPDFPSDISQCFYCQFFEYCKKEGLPYDK